MIPFSSSRRLFAGAVATATLVVVFCLYLLARNPGFFFNDDYQISILPVFADVARAWGEGHWPLLSPYSWACGNLAGEYQYGTFSVFVNLLVVVVWKLPLGFAQQAAALSITHLAVLAAGGYLLARERRLPGAVAAGVGIIASLNGWIMGWGAIDWFGALAAHAWLPWCWWAFEVALRRGGEGRSGTLRFLLPVPFVYLLLTGGFPYTVVMLALVTGWLAVRTWFRSGGDWRRTWPLAVGWGLGLLLSAPAWLSLLDAIHGSARSTQGVGAGNVAWTVPLAALPALILPNWMAPWADFANRPCPHGSLELAGGFVPVVGLLAAVGCLRGKAWRALRWELGLAGAVLGLCLLPSPGLFRWSFRWLPLLHLALALAGGRALHLLASRTRGKDGHWRRWARNPGTWAVACAGLTWAAMIVAQAENDDPVTRALPPWTVGVGIGWAVLAAWPGRRGWTLGVSGLAVCAVTFGTYRYRQRDLHLPVYNVGENLRAVTPLSRDRLYLSLYREADRFYRAWQTPPGFGSVVRMGSTGMFAGVRLINGYSPIMSAGVGKELNLETHGNVPEEIGEKILAEDAGGKGGILADLGVDGLMVAHDYRLTYPPAAKDWAEVYRSEEGVVYHRREGTLGEVREVQKTDGEEETGAGETKIRVVENSRQRVAADVEVPTARRTPVVLSFRRPFYRGYRASLDGRALAVSSQDGLMPTVTLPPGSRGRLTLRYLPRAVVWGGLLAVGGLAAAGLLARRAWVRAG